MVRFCCALIKKKKKNSNGASCFWCPGLTHELLIGEKNSVLFFSNLKTRVQESPGSLPSLVLACLQSSWEVLESSMCSRRWELSLALELLLLPHLFLATSIQGTFHKLSASNCALKALSDGKGNMGRGSTWKWSRGSGQQW